MPSLKPKRIVLGVCGSIAAYKAADIIRRFQENDCAIRVVMTKAAREFITPLTLSALSKSSVYSDIFDTHVAAQMPHIELAGWAQAVVILPATANTIGKLANGIIDDLLTSVVITTRVPVWIVPAMNDAMYAHSLVQENCAKLKKHGMNFVEPVEGKLACGSVGVGHLADSDVIVKKVLAAW